MREQQETDNLTSNEQLFAVTIDRTKLNSPKTFQAFIANNIMV